MMWASRESQAARRSRPCASPQIQPDVNAIEMEPTLGESSLYVGHNLSIINEQSKSHSRAHLGLLTCLIRRNESFCETVPFLLRSLHNQTAFAGAEGTNDSSPVRWPCFASFTFSPHRSSPSQPSTHPHLVLLTHGC